MTGVADWDGPYRSYDLLKEIVVALAVIAGLTILLALLFGAPQRAAVDFRTWATNDPADFLATTLDELTGTSATAVYGPPYNDTADAAQSILGLSPQSLAGVTIPIDTTEDLVLRPLGRLAPAGSDLASALREYRSAPTTQQQAWTDTYRTALEAATTPDAVAGITTSGPVPVMMKAMLTLAQSGGIDAALIDDTAGHPGYFVMDYTRSQLYLADGDYFAGLGDSAGLAGDQWGMTATVGNWPGQVWLLPVSFWYQIPPGSTSGSGDLIVMAIVTVLGAAFIFLPFIPGLRKLPERLGIYRLIWRRHYNAAG